MPFRKRTIVMSLGLGLTLLACSHNMPPTAFDGLGQADRLEISTPHRHIKTLYQADRIHQATQYLAQYSSGWHQEWLVSSLVPEFTLSFYNGEKPLGRFGCQQGSLTTGDSQTWAHSLSDEDREAILGILTIKEVESTSTQILR